MRMKVRYLLVFLLTIVLLAGCGKGKSISTFYEDPEATKVVTDAAEFQKMYTGWAERLTIVAHGTDQAYQEWSSDLISKEEFAEKTRDLYKETKRLKTENSYNIVFSLSAGDQELVDYDLVTAAYEKALMQMKDFLYLLPTLEEEHLVDFYAYTGEIVNDQLDNVKRYLKI
ncbi:MAG: hypothetical protein HQP61_03235 [Peptococcaceae bacterium]|nr:hypothetical protein [Candidatus Syntrophopropionicum ammoniitolerans]